MTFSRRLLRVLPLTLLAVLAVWAAAQDNDDYCGTVGECLGNGFDDLFTLGVAILLGGGLLWALRTPRVLAHVFGVLLVGSSLWYAADEVLYAADAHRDYDTPLPLAAAVAIALLSGTAASYAAGPGGRLLLRLGLLAAAPAVAVAAHLGSEQVLADRDADALADTGLTLYAPVISGHPPEYANVRDDGSVALSYSFPVDEGYAFVRITLERAPRDRELFPGEIEVLRDDMVLVADFEHDVLDPDDVRTALETAPEVGPDDLAD